MFLRIRPDTYEVSHILINTDQIITAWDCFSSIKKYRNVPCLGISFSSKEDICVPYLSVEKLVEILAHNERDAIVDALPFGLEKDINEDYL